MKVYSLSSSITIIATFAALYLPGQVIAQTVNYNTPRFSEAFADPDGTTAAALAKTTGLNIGEATRRLRLMNEAGRMVHALEERFPDTFSGAEALSSSDFRVSIYGIQSASGSIQRAVREMASTGELGSSIDFRIAPASAAATSTKAHGYSEALRRQGLDVVIASNPRVGQFRFLAKEPDAVLVSLVNGAIRAEEGVKIQQFDGIVKTAKEVPGGYGYNGTVLECTRGFNVKQIKGAVYGTSTAGHCDDRGTDAQIGVSQAFKQEWVTNNVDSQWSTFSGKSKYTIVPMFYNGYSILTFTGGQSDHSGLYVCKYGRTSGQTCGYVDPYQYTDGKYGDFPRVNWNSTYDY